MGETKNCPRVCGCFFWAGRRLFACRARARKMSRGGPTCRCCDQRSSCRSSSSTDHRVGLLVNLGGYAGTAKSADIFALRPAPVAVSYMGFPGTMGSDHMVDYILADRVVIPPSLRQFYSEKVNALRFSQCISSVGSATAQRVKSSSMMSCFLQYGEVFFVFLARKEPCCFSCIAGGIWP